MHMIIATIVKASNKEEAIENAGSVFDGITGEGQPFDYYELFNNPGTRVSGRGRWGNVPPVLKLGTKGGDKLLRELMGHTNKEFKENIQRVRKALATYTDEEIREEQHSTPPKEGNSDSDLTFARHLFRQLGEYSGSSVWLYDYQGSGIRTERHLKRVLENYGDEMGDGEALYIVPADVHF